MPTDARLDVEGAFETPSSDLAARFVLLGGRYSVRCATAATAPPVDGCLGPGDAGGVAAAAAAAAGAAAGLPVGSEALGMVCDLVVWVWAAYLRALLLACLQPHAETSRQRKPCGRGHPCLYNTSWCW